MAEGHGAQVRAFLRAKIIFNNRLSTIDCVVRKLSEEGALVDLAGALSLPDHFELEIPLKGRRHQCRLLSRDDAHASLLFEGDGGPSREELSTEIRRLERVVLRLTGRLRALGEEVDLPA